MTFVHRYEGSHIFRDHVFDQFINSILPHELLCSSKMSILFKKPLNSKRNGIIKLFSVMGLLFLTCTSDIQEVSLVNTYNELSIRLDRLSGSTNENKIRGKFRLIVESSLDLIRIVLLFNDTSVAESESDSLGFTFNTEEYGLGEMNITAIGEDSEGNLYQTTIFRNFYETNVPRAFGIGFIIFALVIALYQIWKKIRKRKVLTYQEKKDQIKIDSNF